VAARAARPRTGQRERSTAATRSSQHRCRCRGSQRGQLADQGGARNVRSRNRNPADGRNSPRTEESRRARRQAKSHHQNASATRQQPHAQRNAGCSTPPYRKSDGPPLRPLHQTWGLLAALDPLAAPGAILINGEHLPDDTSPAVPSASMGYSRLSDFASAAPLGTRRRVSRPGAVDERIERIT